MAIHRPWDVKEEEDKIPILKDVTVQEMKQDSKAFIHYTFIRTFSMPVFKVQRRVKYSFSKKEGYLRKYLTDRERIRKMYNEVQKPSPLIALIRKK